MKITEAEITKEIRRLLKLLHIWHWKQWQGPMSQPKGVADILGIYRGKPLAIEVKAPGKKLSKDQEFFMECWKLEGGIAITANSAWDVIKALGVEERFK